MSLATLTTLHDLLVRHLEVCGVSQLMLKALDSALGNVPQIQKVSRQDSKLLDGFQYSLDGTFCLQVSMLSGFSCDMVVHAATTVRELKHALEERTGIPVSEQRLMCGTDILQDAKALVTHNVTPYSEPLMLYRQMRTYIYALGGRNDGAGALDCCEVLDLGADVWSPVPKLGTCRARAGAAAVDGKIYIFGGDDGFGGTLDTAEVFDPETSIWSPLPRMANKRARLAVVVLKSGRICAMGGMSGESYLASVEAFDPSVRVWFRMPDMKTPRSNLAAAIHDGTVYAIGGRQGSKILETVEALAPDAFSWQSMPSMTQARHSLGAVSLNGLIYILGGYDGIRHLDDIELFDPVAAHWRYQGNLMVRCCSFGAASMGSFVIVAGGGGRRGPVNSAECFDVSTGVSRKLASLSSPREGLAVVVI